MRRAQQPPAPHPLGARWIVAEAADIHNSVKLVEAIAHAPSLAQAREADTVGGAANSRYMQGMTQKHQFEGLQNFRDFGGYQAGGRVIQRGRFFRSAAPGMATEADLQRLAEMGLAAIVDLRRPEERARTPSRWDNFSAAVIANDDHHEGEETWAGLMANTDLRVEDIRGYLDRYYRRAVHLPRHIDLFSRYFDAVAESEGAVLVHCAAGKDRTGIVVALTHTLAGVHEDDIFADFLLTNDPDRFARMGPVWAETIEKEYGKRPTPEAMNLAMGVEAPFLHAAFETIRAQHGDVETYIRDVLGVDDAKRKRIEKRLFE